MGRLIVSAQMTMDGVMDQNEGWFEPGRDSGRNALEQLRAADALVLGRETYEFLRRSGPRRRGSGPTSSTRSRSTSRRGRCRSRSRGTRGSSAATSPRPWRP